MGRIVISEFVTLDGVIEDPGGAEQSPADTVLLRYAAA